MSSVSTCHGRAAIIGPKVPQPLHGGGGGGGGNSVRVHAALHYLMQKAKL